MRLRRLDGLDQRLHPLLDRRDDLLAAVAVVAQRVLRQRLAQALQHAVVVDDQAEILAGIDAVGPRDGLHQGVGLHRLVDVERRQALHVEAGQPHGADDGDAERMLRVLEGGLDVHALAVRRLEALLHQRAVRDDVEAPLLEVGDLVLRLADDDLDDGLVQPVRPAPRSCSQPRPASASRASASAIAASFRLLRLGSAPEPAPPSPSSAA